MGEDLPYLPPNKSNGKVGWEKMDGISQNAIFLPAAAAAAAAVLPTVSSLPCFSPDGSSGSSGSIERVGGFVGGWVDGLVGGLAMATFSY